MLTKIKAVILAALILWLCPCSALADCVDHAAAKHGVNPWILRAIAKNESEFHANAFRVDSNGTIDVGINQINEVNFAALAQHGIKWKDLFDPCTSMYAAAWLLHRKMEKHGNTWEAIGAYHSETPADRDAYATRIYSVIENWQRAGIIQE